MWFPLWQPAKAHPNRAYGEEDSGKYQHVVAFYRRLMSKEVPQSGHFKSNQRGHMLVSVYKYHSHKNLPINILRSSFIHIIIAVSFLL